MTVVLEIEGVGEVVSFAGEFSASFGQEITILGNTFVIVTLVRSGITLKAILRNKLKQASMCYFNTVGGLCYE